MNYKVWLALLISAYFTPIALAVSGVDVNTPPSIPPCLTQGMSDSSCVVSACRQCAAAGYSSYTCNTNILTGEVQCVCRGKRGKPSDRQRDIDSCNDIPIETDLIAPEKDPSKAPIKRY